MSKLNTHVIVHDEEHGSVALSPDEKVPKWAEALITNDEVWAEKPTKTSARTPAPSGPNQEPQTPDADTPDPDSDPDNDDEDDDEGSPAAADVPIPPQSGRGSGPKAWTAYALSKGFAIEDENATSKDIRDALAEAGVPVK